MSRFTNVVKLPEDHEYESAASLVAKWVPLNGDPMVENIYARGDALGTIHVQCGGSWLSASEPCTFDDAWWVVGRSAGCRAEHAWAVAWAVLPRWSADTDACVTPLEVVSR